MNLSTSVEEGYRELIDRAEEDVLKRVHKLESCTWSRSDRDERKLWRLRRWLDDLELIRKRETIEQSRRCA